MSHATIVSVLTGCSQNIFSFSVVTINELRTIPLLLVWFSRILHNYGSLDLTLIASSWRVLYSIQVNSILVTY